MANRAQVSLLIANDDTYEFVENLKKQKKLKSSITKFLDKFAENPERVEMWLEQEGFEEFEGLSVQEDEKITKLKSDLAIFSAFVETAQAQNDANLESFTDYLTNEQFIKFKTDFEKSQQILENQDSYLEMATSSQTEANDEMAEKMSSMEKQLEEMKTLILNMSNNNSGSSNPLEIKVTQPVNEPLLVQQETIQKVEESPIVPPNNAVQTEYVEDESEIINPEEEEILVPVSEPKKEEVAPIDVNVDDALEIMDGLF
ncbi:hypothetical protein COF68_05410 [Bacillus toyonensis]|uniref:hypothetical protein n=1 Tax=Bacillus toyonensis TaxID=155322 RepID=UPI000BFB7966|nr:hypothetical protein [Bacillus toyonensis]PHE64281.1 hypothetical protein COF68_05410 [Bacillus toyonensis]